MKKSIKNSVRWDNIAKIAAGLLLFTTYALGYGREDGEWLRMSVIQFLGGKA